MDKIPSGYKYRITVFGNNAVEVAQQADQMLFDAMWINSKADFLVKEFNLNAIMLAIQLVGGQPRNYDLVELPGMIQRWLYKFLDCLPDSFQRRLHKFSKTYDAVLLRSMLLLFLVGVPISLIFIGFNYVEGITPLIKKEIIFGVNALKILFVTFLTIYTWVIVLGGFFKVIISEYFWYKANVERNSHLSASAEF